MPLLTRTQAPCFYDGNDVGSASATASFGNIGVFAEAASNTGGGSDGNDPIAALATAQFTDQVTVSSDTLAIGTPVKILCFVQDDIDSLSDTTTLSHNSTGSAGAVFQSTTTSQSGLFEGSQSSFFSTYYAQRPSLFSTSFLQYAPILDTYVGDTLTVHARVQADASAISHWEFESIDEQASAIHSMLYYSDPMTAGVFLVSASGHNYSSPAPVLVSPDLLLPRPRRDRRHRHRHPLRPRPGGHRRRHEQQRPIGRAYQPGRDRAGRSQQRDVCDQHLSQPHDAVRDGLRVAGRSGQVGPR